METLKAVAAILLIFVALPILILWLNDKLFHRSPSKKELEKYSNRFNERLLTPDFPAAEKHFGCALPDAIRRLYGNKDELQRGDFDVQNPNKGEDEPDTWHVAFHVPLDVEQIRDAWPGSNGLLTFADDGCGNGYVIDPRLSDPEVQFYDHEEGQSYPTGLTLSRFLSAPRRSSLE